MRICSRATLAASVMSLVFVSVSAVASDKASKSSQQWTADKCDMEWDCYFTFVSVDPSAVYSEPKVTSKIIYRMARGLGGLVDPTSRSSDGAWMKYYIPAPNEHLAPGGEAWVRTQDIVLFSQLRKVTACWPIRTLMWLQGDLQEELIEIDTNGVARDINRQGRTGQLFMLKEWWAIKFSSPDENGSMFMGGQYFPRLMSVLYVDEEILHEPDSLRGCEGVVTLE